MALSCHHGTAPPLSTVTRLHCSTTPGKCMRYLLLTTASKPSLGRSYTPIQWAWETFYPVVTDRDDGHSPLSSAEVKTNGCITPLDRKSSRHGT